MFKEAPLPYPSNSNLKLSVSIWLAEEYGSVLLVGHGIMNRLLAKELHKQGWQVELSPSSKHWAFGVYEYAT
ncbi:hypothetical protein [Thiothrix lacustris]|uniref:hypothetical protein n=1 Tax=Thiothrix lacustris TaxID=525917 RepID=UPI0027E3DEF2|nr:hypothetical protein [Thiothrix lacustris]WMP19050.1 hypothetical protein RCS87_08290 [Thiothrix lacustris]